MAGMAAQVEALADDLRELLPVADLVVHAIALPLLFLLYFSIPQRLFPLGLVELEELRSLAIILMGIPVDLGE
jgi:hypothetical protein